MAPAAVPCGKDRQEPLSRDRTRILTSWVSRTAPLRCWTQRHLLVWRLCGFSSLRSSLPGSTCREGERGCPCEGQCPSHQHMGPTLRVVRRILYSSKVTEKPQPRLLCKPNQGSYSKSKQTKHHRIVFPQIYTQWGHTCPDLRVWLYLEIRSLDR